MENIRRQGVENLLSSHLYVVRKSPRVFDELNENYDSGRIFLDKETTEIKSGLEKPVQEESLNLVRIEVENISSSGREKVFLGSLIGKSKRLGLKFCRPEVPFYVASKMLGGDMGVDSINILVKKGRHIRLFYVEKYSDDDVRVNLYDKGSVTGRSLFGRDEIFLFDKRKKNRYN
jgi:hypothetical protein